MSLLKPIRPAPSVSRSGIDDLAAYRSARKRRTALQIGAAVAAGTALGWVMSGTADTPPAPLAAPAQGFMEHEAPDRAERSRRVESAEPPETFSGTMAASGRTAGTAADDGETPARTRAAPAFYRYCADARMAGAAPLHRGEPGYRDALDRDGDGIACEPYSGR